MSFNILRTLSVSFDHLTKDDYNLIEEHAEFVIEYDRYIILVSDCINRQNELESLGFSDGFMKCMIMGFVLGCERVEFSYEGSVIKEIPTYDE